LAAVDVFGVHPQAPSARYDAMGLAFLIGGNEVVDVAPDRASIRHRSGKLLVYMRRPHPDNVAAWELVPSARPA
jgi:hypothetical protein